MSGEKTGEPRAQRKLNLGMADGTSDLRMAFLGLDHPPALQYRSIYA